LDCKDEEEEHPLYEAARKSKADAVSRGETNYGIHLPPELKQK
jgi:hypothetical protein